LNVSATGIANIGAWADVNLACTGTDTLQHQKRLNESGGTHGIQFFPAQLVPANLTLDVFECKTDRTSAHRLRL
jgi:hypothetical protein